MWLNQTGTVPSFRNIWYATAIFPAICGSIVTLYAGGLVIWKRFLWAAATGLSAGLLYTVLTALIAGSSGLDISTPSTWPFRLFFFAVFACIGAIITELRLPDPQLERREK
jgi:hypothetical protein